MGTERLSSGLGPWEEGPASGLLESLERCSPSLPGGKGARRAGWLARWRAGAALGWVWAGWRRIEQGTPRGTAYPHSTAATSKQQPPRRASFQRKTCGRGPLFPRCCLADPLLPCLLCIPRQHSLPAPSAPSWHTLAQSLHLRLPSSLSSQRVLCYTSSGCAAPSSEPELGEEPPVLAALELLLQQLLGLLHQPGASAAQPPLTQRPRPALKRCRLTVLPPRGPLPPRPSRVLASTLTTVLLSAACRQPPRRRRPRLGLSHRPPTAQPLYPPQPPHSSPPAPCWPRRAWCCCRCTRW